MTQALAQRNALTHTDAHVLQPGGHVPIGSKSPVIRRLLTSHRLAPMARDGISSRLGSL